MALIQLIIYGLMQLDLKKEHIIQRTSVLATLNQVKLLLHLSAMTSTVSQDHLIIPLAVHSPGFTGDPLWDGAGCGGQEGPCCNRAGLPWFKKSLSIPTTASISVRVCRDTSRDENIGIQHLELYIK